MLSIRDIMTREVYTLPPSATAEEAASILSYRGVSGAPVRDTRGRLIGVLSKSDLTDPERAAGNPAERKVAELMTPGLFTLPESEAAIEAIRLMVREGIHRIVVLDRAGELAGIVTPMDVLKALVKGDELGDELSDRPRVSDYYRQRAEGEAGVMQ